MNINGLGKGLSALIPDDLKKDFMRENEDGNANSLKVKNNIKKREIDIDVVSNDSSPSSEKEKSENEFDMEVKDSKVDIKKDDAKDHSYSSNAILAIPLEKIKINKNQPRKEFSPEKLESLAKSINRHGLLNPITVKELSQNEFEIIAGERRYRAAKLSGLNEIPSIVRNVDPKVQLELALIENLQREDLNPIEEALAYKTLVRDFGLTQDEIADRVQKSRPVITNTLRYLNLPEVVQEGLAKGIISAGHAKVILTVHDCDFQIELFNKIVSHKLTVRNLQKIIDNKSSEKEILSSRNKNKLSPIMIQREKKISDILGLKVKITPKQKGGGKIVLQYFNEEDLERLMESINNKD